MHERICQYIYVCVCTHHRSIVCEAIIMSINVYKHTFVGIYVNVGSGMFGR